MARRCGSWLGLDSDEFERTFPRRARKGIHSFSLLERLTGNFNSLMYQKIPCSFQGLMVHETGLSAVNCAVSPGYQAQTRGRILAISLLKFPVSREMQPRPVAQDCPHRHTVLRLCISESLLAAVSLLGPEIRVFTSKRARRELREAPLPGNDRQHSLPCKPGLILKLAKVGLIWSGRGRCAQIILAAANRKRFVIAKFHGIGSEPDLFSNTHPSFRSRYSE